MVLSISSARMRIDATTRALVTGASRGIGLALARALAGRGAAVGLLARSGRARALARELGPRAVALPADVGDREQVRAAVARFIEQAGGLDLVVANAGIAHYGPFLAPGRRARRGDDARELAGHGLHGRRRRSAT